MPIQLLSPFPDEFDTAIRKEILRRRNINRRFPFRGDLFRGSDWSCTERATAPRKSGVRKYFWIPLLNDIHLLTFYNHENLYIDSYKMLASVCVRFITKCCRTIDKVFGPLLHSAVFLHSTETLWPTVCGFCAYPLTNFSWNIFPPAVLLQMWHFGSRQVSLVDWKHKT